MSANKIRITSLDVPDFIPSHYVDSDGNVSFDLEPDTAVAITKQIDDANNVGKLKQDTVRNFTLPCTPKNRLLFGDIGNPNAFNFNHRKPIPIRIVSGTEVLPEQEFVVRRTGDQPFEIEAFGQQNQWIKGISDVKISDIDFGTIDSYDFDYIKDINENGYEYADGGSAAFVPIASYGKYKEAGRISVEDLRIWVSPLHVLREGFCLAGWEFVCPMLSSSLGRRLWSYLLAEDFENKASSTGVMFLATLSSDLPIPTPINNPLNDNVLIFDNDSILPGFDNGNLYNSSTGLFQVNATNGSSIVSDYTTIVNINGSISAGQSFVSVSIIKKNTLSNFRTTLATAIGANEPGTTHSITVEAKNAVIGIFDVIFVEVFGFNFTGTIVANNSRFYNTPTSVNITSGDTIVVSNLINTEYNVLQFLRGMVHLYDWKVETDNVNKKVSFYPEAGGSWYTEGVIESFFKNDDKAKDWTNKVKKKSLQIEMKSKKSKRNFLLKFKDDSEDWKAKNTGFTYPIHSKNIDFGADFDEGTKKSENPFFAGTVNDFEYSIRWSWDGTPSDGDPDSAPYIPILWKDSPSDSGELPEQMKKIVPRIVMAFPYSRVIFENWQDSGFSTSGDIRVTDDTVPAGNRNLALYAPCGNIFPEGFISTDFTNTIQIDNAAVVYGTDEYNKSLPGNYEIFYERSIERIYLGFPLEFLIKLSFLDVASFSPREKIFIRYNSKRFGEIVFYSRVSKISDFVINKDIPTPVLLIPNDNNFATNCCSCGVFIDLTGTQANLVNFSALIVGNCGEISSYEWTLTNLQTNVAIIGANDESSVSVGGAGNPGAFVFTINLEVVTECGIYTKSLNYGQ